MSQSKSAWKLLLNLNHQHKGESVVNSASTVNGFEIWFD